MRTWKKGIPKQNGLYEVIGILNNEKTFNFYLVNFKDGKFSRLGKKVNMTKVIYHKINITKNLFNFPQYEMEKAYKFYKKCYLK